MRQVLSFFAICALASVPAVAQNAQPQQPQGEKKTVTKLVCERVSVEETTGSRLGSAPKVCKKVEVPADASNKKAREGQAPNHSGH